MPQSRNEKDVFRSLLAPHMDALFRAAWRLTGRADEAEDLVQELLVRLYPKTHQMRQVEQLRPWLKKALYRQFIDLERKKARRPENFLDASDFQMDDLQGEAPDPELMAQRAGNRQRLRAALQTLDPESRALVLMHLVEGYSLAELEETFQVSKQTLKTRLRRSKNQLKKFLQR